ncbi:MAG: lipopolysaccharide biosynthesis protein [Pontibacterium sp.]
MTETSPKREVLRRLSNVALRGLSMGSRFVLLFALARYLEPEEVGLYGLVAATLGFSMLVIGGDYYTYSQRELISSPKERWSFVLQHQGLATVLLYTALLPVQALIFVFELLPYSVLLWFFALLITEHLAQECNRVLIAMQQQLWASMVLFIRMGIWVWVLLCLMVYAVVPVSLDTVFAFWFVGDLLALIVSVVLVKAQVPEWRWWPLDWPWVRAGFKVGLMFLFATLAFKALQTIDRYFVEFWAGSELLAVYVLYSGVAMAVVSFLDSAVFAFLYPKLIAAWREQRYQDYQKVKKELWCSVLISSVLLALSAGLLAPWVFEWIGKDIYNNQPELLWILLAGAVIYAVGMVPHYGLYARKADKAIVFSHITSLVVFVIVSFLCAEMLPLEAPAIGLAVAFVWMLFVKQYMYQRLPVDVI